MVNQNGQGVILPVTTVSSGGGNYTLSFGCKNTISYNGNVVYKVRTLGYQYNPSTNNLVFTSGIGGEQVAAFDLNSFAVDYVYLNTATNGFEINPTGYNSGGQINRQFGNYNLQRVQLQIGAAQKTWFSTIQRSYSSQVELPNTILSGGIVPCNP
jgi:hypothetical protein